MPSPPNPGLPTSRTPGPRTPDPKVILIADRFTEDEIAEKTLEAVEAGIRWVHLRDHRAGADAFKVSAGNLVRQIRNRAPEAIISINRRLDVAVACGLSFHTSALGPSIGEAKKQLLSDMHLGYSCHSEAEARQAVKEGADYIYCSPVFPTASKPGHTGTGLDALSSCCTAVWPVPVYALGGITPDRVNACLENGAHGVAVMSGIFTSNAIPQTVAAYTAEASRRDATTSNEIDK